MSFSSCKAFYSKFCVSYGETWATGDVIGCCIDLDDGNVSYYRNGRELGVAFSSVLLGPGMAYFPALSLSDRERCRLNFGSTPFAHPVTGYSALQTPNTTAVSKMEYLMTALKRLLVNETEVARVSNLQCSERLESVL